MAEQVTNNDVPENRSQDLLTEEAYTEFPSPHLYGGDPPGYRGRFFAFFNKYFNDKKRGRPRAVPPLAGDAKSSADETFDDYAGGYGKSSSTYAMPRVEQERRRKYKDFEKMDEYAEIGAALDIYSDDATQENIKGDLFELDTDNDILKREVERFVEQTSLDKHIWDIIRNVAKYGDCFVENVVDLNDVRAGIQRLKILNPNFLYRIEDKYGYLKEFIQEIPNKQQTSSDYAINFVPDKKKKNFIRLDKDQLIHFRRRTSDPNYYPYGKSILAYAIRAFKSLVLMEDAMLIYRIQRAPERRAFYLETGNLPSSKVEAFVQRIQMKFKKQPMWNASTKTIDQQYNPLAVDEDFFIPVRNGMGTKIEVLPGAQNLGETDDVKYFRDKVLAALKVPKDFIVEKDKSPERKANLSQLDVKFAKAVQRLQRDVETSLTVLLRRHLTLVGMPKSLIDAAKIKLTSPSDMFEKRRLEVDEQKVRIVQAVKGLMLFDDEYLYKTYFHMTDSEISDMKDRMKKQAEEQPQQPGMGGMMGGGAPPAPVGEQPDAPQGAEAAGIGELDADETPPGTTEIGK
tara:strand:- start:36433 stop:38142 length:1710 start_codon:yes stop_codon:yes gene_type:complete